MKASPPHDGRRLVLFTLWSAGVAAVFLGLHIHYLLDKLAARWAQM